MLSSLIAAALLVAGPTHSAGSCHIQHIRGHVAADRRCTPGLVVKGSNYEACKAYNHPRRHVTAIVIAAMVYSRKPAASRASTRSR